MKKSFLLLIMLFTSTLFAQDLQTKLQKILEKNQLMGLTVHTFSEENEKTYNIGLRNDANKLPITNNTKFIYIYFNI